MSSGDRFDFLNGLWVAVDSSNVAEGMYDAEAESLYLGFHGHGGGVSYYEYPRVSDDMADSFANASSHGEWVWEYLRRGGWPYNLLSTRPTAESQMDVAQPVPNVAPFPKPSARAKRFKGVTAPKKHGATARPRTLSESFGIGEW